MAELDDGDKMKWRSHADAREPQPAWGLTTTLNENIQAMRRRREDERADRGPSERIAEAITRFTGSMAFVLIHLVLYGGWLAINLGLVPAFRRFDPSFVVLAMEASVEAIFLSTFVLISQNRMAAAADRRADLDLHINLLAEHELTKVARLVEQIADKLNIRPDGDLAFEEVKKDVEPGRVLDALDRARSEVPQA